MEFPGLAASGQGPCVKVPVLTRGREAATGHDHQWPALAGTAIRASREGKKKSATGDVALKVLPPKEDGGVR